jgi:AmmeMemoRadiSam system protein B
LTDAGIAEVRQPAVAGSFYPAQPERLGEVVASLIGAAAEPGAAPRPLGVLVPHAGLAYSGRVAAAGWRSLLRETGPSPTVVILGTNHTAWIDGVAVDPSGAWRTPTGDIAVDGDTAREILALGPPFAPDRNAHRAEHSIEVQLPILEAIRPDARIVPCSVAAGTGSGATAAGGRLGELLAALRARGDEVLLAISTDMAHYPVHRDAVRVTERLLPAITSLDACATAALERAEARSGAPGMACGMCGIQPTVLGLAALRAMGATLGSVLDTATSADAGAAPERTVGYLAVAFG